RAAAAGREARHVPLAQLDLLLAEVERAAAAEDDVELLLRGMGVPRRARGALRELDEVEAGARGHAVGRQRRERAAEVPLGVGDVEDRFRVRLNRLQEVRWAERRL